MDMNAARYAVIFAADVDPDAYQNRMNTDEFEDFALSVGVEIERRRVIARAADADFYPAAVAEQGAIFFNTNADATVESCLAFGQAESDAIAGEPLQGI